MGSEHSVRGVSVLTYTILPGAEGASSPCDSRPTITNSRRNRLQACRQRRFHVSIRADRAGVDTASLRRTSGINYHDHPSDALLLTTKIYKKPSHLPSNPHHQNISSAPNNPTSFRRLPQAQSPPLKHTQTNPSPTCSSSPSHLLLPLRLPSRLPRLRLLSLWPSLPSLQAYVFLAMLFKCPRSLANRPLQQCPAQQYCYADGKWSKVTQTCSQGNLYCCPSTGGLIVSLSLSLLRHPLHQRLTCCSGERDRCVQSHQRQHRDHSGDR